MMKMNVAVRDLIFCVAAFFGLVLIAGRFDVLEWWYVLSRDHEDWELDELFAATSVFFLVVGWYAYRRWRDARERLRESIAVNRQLNEEIDAREQAQQTLRESEARIRNATELARLGYYVWDALDDRCLYCSDEFAAMHGLTANEYISRAATLDDEFTLTHPDDREAVKSGMLALRDGETFEMEYRIVTPDGAIRYLREIAHPVFDADGRVVREMGVCQDITEMKRAETLLTRALDFSSSLFALYDSEDRLVICNQKYRDLYDTAALSAVPGVSFEALVRSFAAATGVGETDASTDDWMARRLNRRAEPAQNYEYRRGDGEWVEVSDHILEDGSVFTVASVVTERKRIEEELRQRQKMEVVGQLTGGIAHDFNNLLSVILGNAENLEDTLGTEDGSVRAIFRAAERGAELTQRLLAYSRRQPLLPSIFDPATLVAGMETLLSRAIGESIEFELDIGSPLWSVRADPGQLENALLNLAINARHAMPAGGKLRISVANAPIDGEPALERIQVATGDYVSVKVSDTGDGMAPEVLEHAFEPFFTTKDVGEGSGLGLSMVYGFAKQSGGDVHIESVVGCGTDVTLYLPRGRKRDAA